MINGVQTMTNKSFELKIFYPNSEQNKFLSRASNCDKIMLQHNVSYSKGPTI
jgi:hypothetical protein